MQGHTQPPTADTPEEWQKLLASPDANIVRSAEEWSRLISDPERRKEILPDCDDEVVDRFSKELVFFNGGLAGADYGMLVDILTARQIYDIWTHFGIGNPLAEDYEGYHCEKHATCYPRQKAICTSNCYPVPDLEEPRPGQQGTP